MLQSGPSVGPTHGHTEEAAANNFSLERQPTRCFLRAPKRKQSRRQSDGEESRQALTPSPQRLQTQHHHYTDSQPTMISLSEYKSLPTAIQRKYFKSVERLYVNGRSCSEKHRTHASEEMKTAPRPYDEAVERPSTSPGPAKRPILPTTNSSNMYQVCFDKDDSLSEEEARWFLNLPEKIRRQQFTREEQVSMTARCERLLLEASRQSTVKVQEHPHPVVKDTVTHGLNSMTGPSSATDRAVPITGGQQISKTSGDQAGIARISQVSQIKSDFHETPLAKRNSVPPVSTRRGLSASQAKKHRRNSLHRAVTLTPLPIPPPTLAPAPALLSPETRDNFTLSNRLSRPFFDTLPRNQAEDKSQAIQQLDSDVQELLDYLPSSQEYGVISIEPATPTTVTENTEGGSFFFRDSHYEHDAQLTEADDESLEDNSPSTPIASPITHAISIRKAKSFDSGVSLGWHRDSKDDIKVEVSSLEPLALETLPVCDDPTGAQGAFAVPSQNSQKSLKRVWQSIRRL